MSSTEVKKHVIKTFPELKGLLRQMQEDNSCILPGRIQRNKVTRDQRSGNLYC